MENVVITEVDLAARLFRSGLVNHCDSSGLGLYMSDFCYYAKAFSYNKDKDFVKEMVNAGKIKIISLSDTQLERASKLLTKFYPKFILRTVAAFVIASDMGYAIVSEDEVLRSTAKNDLGILTFDKGWLLDKIIDNIRDENLVHNAKMLKMVV